MSTFNYNTSGVSTSLQHGLNGGSMVWNTDHFESTSDGSTLIPLWTALTPVNANDGSSKNYIDTLPTSYDIMMWYSTAPTTGVVMFSIKLTTMVTLQDNFANSVGIIVTNPTASFVMTVERNSVQIGTITVSTGGIFTFATSGATTEIFNAGDHLTITAPVAVDATASAISVTLSGTVYNGIIADWNPLSLFMSGEIGFIFNIGDISTLYQDDLQTTPVLVDGDPVGSVKDLSGHGNHMRQATASRRPLYRTNSGKPYLQFDNSNDYLNFTNGSLHYPDISVHVGVAQYDTASTTIGVPQDSFHTSPYFRWSIWALSSTVSESRFNGITRQSAALNWWQNPIHYGFDTVAGEFYENGVVNATFPTVTLTYPNTTTPRLGANASGGENSAMRFYGGVATNRGLTTTEISDVGTWIQALF